MSLPRSPEWYQKEIEDLLKAAPPPSAFAQDEIRRLLSELVDRARTLQVWHDRLKICAYCGTGFVPNLGDEAPDSCPACKDKEALLQERSELKDALEETNALLRETVAAEIKANALVGEYRSRSGAQFHTFEPYQPPERSYKRTSISIMSEPFEELKEYAEETREMLEEHIASLCKCRHLGGGIPMVSNKDCPIHPKPPLPPRPRRL